MSDAKPFASLSSGLLARKGGAKPAMRPHAFGHVSSSVDDLGWNDMGHDEPDPQPAPVPLGLTPAPQRIAAEPVAPPPVIEQQRELQSHYAAPEAAEEFEAPVETPVREAADHEVVALPRRRSRPGPVKAKAAFTLRLDADRHLKLRLASALTRRSAQQIVTEALDAFVEGIPEIDAFARRLPGEAKKAG
jgi:hypothetical protein